MTRYYAFNGDADGVCALQQLRLSETGDATLVTGVKRDIRLLDRVDALAGDEVTVLDISLDRNRTALLRLLGCGALVRYFDHHYAGELPEHPRFEAHIEEIYGVKVGRDLISKVTDEVMDDVRAWSKRPLEDIYPIVFLDCMVLKIRESCSSPNEDSARKLVYLALQNATPQWMRTRNWTAALLAFKIHFGDRVPDTAG